MRASTSCVLATLLCAVGTAAAACEAPSPVAIPDGATAKLDQMLAAQAEIRAYQAAMNEFIACIDAEGDAQGEQAPAEVKSLMIERHNAAVTELEGVAA